MYDSRLAKIVAALGLVVVIARGSSVMCVHAAEMATPRNGNESRSAARQARRDGDVDVPDLELIPLRAALSGARRAGLQPVVVDLYSLKEIDVSSHRDRVVLRQGISPGVTAARGESLLLAVRVTHSLTAAVPRKLCGRYADLPDQSPIRTNDRLGFVSLNTDTIDVIDGFAERSARNPVGTNAVAEADTATSWRSDPSPSLGSVDLSDFDEPALNESVAHTNVATETEKSHSASDEYRVYLNGRYVSIDPLRDLSNEQHAALLIPLNEAAFDFPSGPFGNALLQASTRYGAQIANELLGGAPELRAEITEVFLLTAQELGVEARREFAEDAYVAWQSDVRSTHPDLIDENGNRHVCDDIMVWFVNWMQREDRYNPARHVRLERDASGDSVAVFSEVAMDPEWLEEEQDSLIFDSASSRSDELATVTTEDVTVESGGTQHAVIAEVLEPLTIQSGPDSIRVPPALAGRSATECAHLLRDAGLRIARDGRFFRDDRVVSTKPASGQWVRPEAAISLRISRKIPDVKGLPAKQAIDKLAAREFKARPLHSAVKYRADDIVVEQRAAVTRSDGYYDRGTLVQVRLQREVPDIVGKTVAEAEKLLNRLGFRSRRPTDSLAADRVVEQSPQRWDDAVKLADIGSTVECVRVATLMPDLQGTSLSRAKTWNNAKRLLLERKLRYEFIGAATDFAAAKILEQSPPAGTFVDRNKTSVKLRLVVPLPTLTEEGAPLADIDGQLRDRELIARMSVPKVWRDDRAFVLEPLGETFQDGRTLYALPQTVVQVMVGRKVPNVSGASWQEAVALLARRGMAGVPPTGEMPGSAVYGVPSADRYVDPRRPVVLLPGERVPKITGLTLGQADAVLNQIAVAREVVGSRVMETENPELINVVGVLQQVPAPGQIVPTGRGLVRVMVVEFREKLYQVPNLVGLSLREANQAAGLSAMRLQDVTIIPGPSRPEELVVKQDPPAGMQVRAGTTLRVIVRPTKVGHDKPQPGGGGFF